MKHVLLAGCTVLFCLFAQNVECRTPQIARYHVTITDRPDLKRFELRLTSYDDRPICVEQQRWPNHLGRIHYGSYWAVLQSSKKSYPAINENLGRCVGPGCIIHIAPGETLKGFINYSVFGKEKDIAALSGRHLQLDVKAEPCAVFDRLMKAK